MGFVWFDSTFLCCLSARSASNVIRCYSNNPCVLRGSTALRSTVTLTRRVSKRGGSATSANSFKYAKINNLEGVYFNIMALQRAAMTKVHNADKAASFLKDALALTYRISEIVSSELQQEKRCARRESMVSVTPASGGGAGSLHDLVISRGDLSTFSAASSPSLSHNVRRQSILIGALQHLIVFLSFKLRRNDLLKYQTRISAFLLSPLIRHPKSHDRDYQEWERSLQRRGVKSYVELLTHYGAAPKNIFEWNAMCSLFFPNAEHSTVAEIPILSAHRRNVAEGKSLNDKLTLILTGAECRALIRWSKIFASGKHISSGDIENALRHTLQEDGERETKSAAQQKILDDLAGMWNVSKLKEDTQTVTVGGSGFAHQRGSKLEIKGSTIVFKGLDVDDSRPLKGFNEQLTMGQWRPVLQDIMNRLFSLHFDEEDGVAKHKASECSFVGGAFPQDIHTASYQRIREHLQRFFRNSKVPYWKKKKVLVVSKHLLPPPPSSYLSIDVSKDERKLIVSPPSKGLSLPLTVTDIAELEASCSNPIPSCVTRWRRRVWMLSLLPPYYPRSLVRFMENHKGKRSFPVPFMERSPLRELLGWFLVSLLSMAVSSALDEVPCAADSTLQSNRGDFNEEIFKSARQFIEPIFFFSTDTSYAALNEHCSVVHSRLGLTAASSLFSNYIQKQYPTSQSKAINSSLSGPAQTVRNLVCSSVKHFFAPPTPAAYKAAASSLESVDRNGATTCRCSESAIQIWKVLQNEASGRNKETAGDSPPKVRGTFLPSPSRSALDMLHPVGDAALHNTGGEEDIVYEGMEKPAQEFFVAKASCFRNYHFSVYMETLSPLASVEEILDAMTGEINDNGPPVLCPETACALLNSLVLQLVYTDTDKSSLQDSIALLKQSGCNRLFFILPVDKVQSLSSYFRGVYHPSFVKKIYGASREIGQTPFVAPLHWSGAEALLSGRTLRLCERYPTSTMDRFLHLSYLRDESRQVKSVFVRNDAPPLQFFIAALEMCDAVEYFMRQRKKDIAASGRSGVPRVLGDRLPSGVYAVFKPPEVTCTLHAQHVSLLPFLHAHFPCGREGLSCMPALHQHGLINRIDVGTSGIVLAARDFTSLLRGIASSSVHRQVRKFYWALVQKKGKLEPSTLWYLPSKGIVSSPVFANGGDASLSSASDAMRLPVALLDQRRGVTAFRVLEFFPRHHVYLVEMSLVSGRRHQIRQHFARLGFPLMGDTRYSGVEEVSSSAELQVSRPALHAHRVEVEDAVADCSVADKLPSKTVVECQLPDDMRSIIYALRRQNNTKKRKDN